MTLVDFFVAINTPKLNVPSTFRPTYSGRTWFVFPFDGNPFWTVVLAIVPSLLGNYWSFKIFYKFHKFSLYSHLHGSANHHGYCQSKRKQIEKRLWLSFGLVRFGYFDLCCWIIRLAGLCSSYGFVHQPCQLIKSWVTESCSRRSVAVHGRSVSCLFLSLFIIFLFFREQRVTGIV